MAFISGMILFFSSAIVIALLPGPVASPPRSRIVAPSSSNFCAWLRAFFRSRYSPPSEKESLVTLITPINVGKSFMPLL